ncbi:MAG TPA: hypothetical protein PLW39_05035 [Thermoflexales bacterium]|nr:hypothetical protein [Thermoflexales bacterium]
MKIAYIFVVMGLLIATFFFPAGTTAAPQADLVVYDDALASGWQDWSWNATRNFANTAPVHAGTNSLSVSLDAAWAGFSLRVNPALAGAGYTALTFWIHGGAGSTKQLQFYIQQTDGGGGTSTVNVDAPAGAWTPITITLASLGSPGAIARLNWQDRTGAAQSAFYLDDVRLVAGGSGPTPTPTPAVGGMTANIAINNLAAGAPFDARLLGTNLPTWLGQSKLESATFRARTTASGVSVIRLPGGSYSNTYGWLSCEMRANQSGAQPCGSGWESWVARPTDFLNFLKATGKQGMWVVDPNGTKQEAAAVVAFFNSPITDTTSLGIDIRGTNWYTAGHWAQLRAAHGNPSPYTINLWAFGNEVFAGKPGSVDLGGLCTAWGWEVIWTCDGTQYVTGATGGQGYHEGYTEFRNMMRAVDPSILFGAVGTNPANDFADWGNKVLAAAGSTMDFYDIHPYVYYNPPADFATALAAPQTHWASVMLDARTAMTNQAGGRAIPVGATEYNMFSVQDMDNGQWLTRMVNGLFIADSIGQMAQNGYALANQWDLANGRTTNGTEYGLMHEDNGWFRSPQYYAFVLWSRFGNTFLPATNSLNPATQLSVYGGRVNTSTVSLLAVNKAGMAITASITVSGSVISGGLMDTAQASALSDQTAIFNGQSNPADDLSNAPPQTLSVSGALAQVVLPANSVTLVRLNTRPVLPRVFVPLVMRQFSASW